MILAITRQRKSSILLKLQSRTYSKFRSSHRRCSVEKMFLKTSQNYQKNPCARVSFLLKLLAQVFSCEFCKIFKNTFFHRTPPVATSANNELLLKYLSNMLLISGKHQFLVNLKGTFFTVALINCHWRQITKIFITSTWLIIKLTSWLRATFTLRTQKIWNKNVLKTSNKLSYDTCSWPNVYIRLSNFHFLPSIALMLTLKQ